MKVSCKYNSLKMVKDIEIIQRLSQRINLSDNDDLGIDIGKEYVVYGVVFWDNSPWFYICEDEEDTYPTPFPAEFFDIKNNRFPADWQLSFRCTDGIPESELVFSEWASDPMFYEKLVDGCEKELVVFSKYKKLLK